MSAARQGKVAKSDSAAKPARVSVWNFMRLALAAFLLWMLLADAPARRAHWELAALPDWDFAAQSQQLLERGRFADAITQAEAGLALERDSADRAELVTVRDRAKAEQESWLRRARDVGLGALTGPGGGQGLVDGDDDYTTLERLAGAVVADFLVLGDVRDLLIQSIRGVRGQEVDPLILTLSAVGVFTTAAPQGDWIPSLLKSARKLGTLTRRTSDALIELARTRDLKAITEFVGDVRALSRSTSPAMAVRLLRLVDEPSELRRLTRFVEQGAGAAPLREGKLAERAATTGATTGATTAATTAARSEDVADASARSLRAFALDAAGRTGARMLLETVVGSADAARVEKLLLAGAKKGPAFERWLASSPKVARALLRPHPLVGVLKGLTKGTLVDLVQRVIDGVRAALLKALGGWGIAALIGALGFWVVLELGLVIRRVAWIDARR